MTSLPLPGLPSAQGLPGPDVGARPGSEGHGRRDPQTPLPDEGGPAVLHRPSDEAEQDEMRYVTLRPPDTGGRRVPVQMEQNTPAHRGQRSQTGGLCFGLNSQTVLWAAEWKLGVQEYSIFLCESLNCGECVPFIRRNKAVCVRVRARICVCVCVRALLGEKSREATTCPSSDFSRFPVFVLVDGPDLESFRTEAVLFFHLDSTWILSVKVGFCTPIECFEGAVRF